MVLLLLLLLEFKLLEWKAEDSGERKLGDLQSLGSRFNGMLELSQPSFWCSRIVVLGSLLVRSDLSEGVLPLEVSVEAPEEIGFSDTHSDPSTVTKNV